MACYCVVQHNEEMDEDEARRRFEAARVGRLATVTSNRMPHLVPVVFALVDDFLYRQSTTNPRPPWRCNDWPMLTRRAGPACSWTSTPRTGPPCGGSAHAHCCRRSGPV